MTSPYPWMRSQWMRIQERLEGEQMPHGLLITGSRDLGIHRFAQLLAQSCMCEARQNEGLPCGRCEGCRWFIAGSHPDFLHVEKDADSHQIRVDQVRSLIEFVALCRQRAQYQVVLLSDAEAMNRNAANSLLKTLEEPPAHSVFLLVSEQPTRLPATILSRCQRLECRAPPRSQGLSWLRDQGLGEEAELLLNLAHGAPPAALDLAGAGLLEQRRKVFAGLLALVAGDATATRLAKQWDGLDPQLLMDWLLGWWADLVRLALGVAPTHLDNSDLYQDLRGLSRQVDLRSGFKFQDQLQGYKRMVDISLNRQLLVEDIVLAWRDLFQQS